jgi:hypothetical protein
LTGIVLTWKIQKREMENILQHTEVTINNFMRSYLHPLQSSRPTKNDGTQNYLFCASFSKQKRDLEPQVSLTITRSLESQFTISASSLAWTKNDEELDENQWQQCML